MRSVLVLAAVAAVFCAGCQKQQTQESMTSTQAPPPPAAAPALEPVDAGKAGSANMATDDYGAATPIKSTPAAAPASNGSAAHAGQTYIVQKGDTLSSIARKVYNDQKRWKDIAAANPGIDPNKLTIGTKLVLPAK